MRLIGRRRSEDASSIPSPDAIFQLGDRKIPLKAEEVLGTNLRQHFEAQKPSRDISTADTASNDGRKAVEALARMQETLSFANHAGVGGGPWSPDDLFPTSATSNYNHSQVSAYTGYDQETSTTIRNDSTGSTNLSYYDPAEQPFYLRQQTSASAVRDMALHKGAPTIFDNLGDRTRSKTTSMLPGMNGSTATTDRKKRHSTIKKPRKLDLVHLFPHPKAAQGSMLSPSRVSRSPAALTDTSDFPPPSSRSERPNMSFLKSVTTISRISSPRSSSGTSAKKSKTKADDHVFQPKTNVRRPPKGTQNWFDAFTSSDEEENNDDEGDEELSRPRVELPADEPASPMYDSPPEHISRLSMRRSLSFGPSEDDSKAMLEQRYRRHSASTVESDIPPRYYRGEEIEDQAERQVESRLTQQSTLSLSSSTSSDCNDDHDATGRRPAPTTAYNNRHSTLDPRVTATMGGSSMPMDTRRMTAPHSAFLADRLDGLPRSHHAKINFPETQARNKPLPHLPSSTSKSHADRTSALRRLNGLSTDSRATAATDSTSTTFQDIAMSPRPPSSIAHVMAVTEEEKVLLDMMRRKRAAMQQMSFTEGYQMALQREVNGQGGGRHYHKASQAMRKGGNDAGSGEGRGGLKKGGGEQSKAQRRMGGEDGQADRWRQMREDEIHGGEDGRMQRSFPRHSTAETIMPIELPTTRPADDEDDTVRLRTPRQHESASRKSTPKTTTLTPDQAKTKGPDSHLVTPTTIRHAKRTSSSPSPIFSEEGPEIPLRNSSRKSIPHLPPSQRQQHPYQRQPQSHNLSQIHVYSPSSPSSTGTSLHSFPMTTNTIDYAPYAPAPPPKSTSPLSEIIATAVPVQKGRARELDVNVEKSWRRSVKTPQDLPTTTSAAATSTSASEEILAAWADLGGGVDALHAKKRRSRVPV